MGSRTDLLASRSWGRHRRVQGIEAKVHFVEVCVQLDGRFLGSTPAFYGDAHDPCPEGQELLEGGGDLRVRDAQFVLQLREVGVLGLAWSTWAGLEVLDRAGYLLPLVSDIHETFGYTIKLWDCVAEDGLRDITRL